MCAAKLLKPADRERNPPIHPARLLRFARQEQGRICHRHNRRRRASRIHHRGSPNDAYILKRLKDKAERFERLGTYTSPDDNKLDVLVVHLTNESKLERARTAIRNFVADHLKTRDEKDAALVAFVSRT